MITISLKESIAIGTITIVFAILIQSIVYVFGDEDIKETNLFYKHKKSIIFYITMFIFGLLIHLFVKYIEYDQWFCKKVCKNINDCKVLCTLPLNGFTNLLIDP